jgi:hypothetical protein
MANDKRLRAQAVGGLVEDNPLTISATTLTSAGLAALPAVGSTEQAAIMLDPDGAFGAPEVAYVTAHTAGATTATVVRAREGSTARQHDRDVPWVHGPTPWDYSPALTKAGAVTDADFVHAPPDGTQAHDTTNNRLYVRINGTWRYTTLT